ncbi:hypothetical protein ACU5AX_20475 [Sphingomonas sp. XXL09]|uniref:hypothetical protein n=1 Tax=Sphingomonas sp. XXL09 TaxID=3457787 RepID=UPI00406BAD1E
MEAWLREDRRLVIERLPQKLGTKLHLLLKGDKRPDFAAAFDENEDYFFVDAKLPDTNGLTYFSLSQEEIHDFRLGIKQLGSDTLLIALVSREGVDLLFLIGLDEIAADNEFGPPGVFKLDPNDEGRRFGPIGRPAYDVAVTRLRHEGFSGDLPAYPDPDPACQDR